jgi:hypothetical protein
MNYPLVVQPWRKKLQIPMFSAIHFFPVPSPGPSLLLGCNLIAVCLNQKAEIRAGAIAAVMIRLLLFTYGQSLSICPLDIICPRSINSIDVQELGKRN